MRILQTADLTPEVLSALSAEDKHHIYNGLDCCCTLEIFEVLREQLDPVAQRTYNFSLALQAPILEMNMRGTLVDREYSRALVAEYRRDMDRVREQLSTIFREGIGYEKTWYGKGGAPSTKALKEIFYEILHLPPVRKRDANGKYTPTVNREALEKLKVYSLAEPIINHILCLRDLGKRVGFLETDIDSDNRIRTSFNIAGTTTGRLASANSEFGSGTNLQNVERRLRRVLIADPGYKFANIDLEQADARNVGAIIYNLFNDSAYLDACESGDLHTTVCAMAWSDLTWTNDRKRNREIADGIAYRDLSYRDMAKKLGHGCLTEEHEVLTRDGWVPIYNKPWEILTWSLDKSEFAPVSNWVDKDYTGKLQLFKGNSISAQMTHDHRVPYCADPRNGNIHTRPAERGPGAFMPLGGNYVGGTEVVPARLIAAHMADGSTSYNVSRFHFHKDRKFKRLAELCEQYGYRYQRSGDKVSVYGNFPKHPGAFMFNWTRQCLQDFIDELKHWDGHIGKTAVTISSSNFSDLKWYQTFGRILGIGGSINGPQISGFGTVMYTLQQNNRKWASGKSVIHTHREVSNVRVLCPTVPSGWFYVRRHGKIFITGNTNYYGQPATMARHTKVATPLIATFQQKYFTAFPGIKQWHLYVIQSLVQRGQLTTPLGRRRLFFGRRTEDSTIREAIAYEPQSMTADQIDTALLRIWREYPQVQLLLQVHDSILLQYPEHLEQELLPKLVKACEVHIPLRGGRDFYVPAEAKVGWNWADQDERNPSTNPNGLVKWKGIDTRSRYLPPATSIIDRFLR